MIYLNRRIHFVARDAYQEAKDALVPVGPILGREFLINIANEGHAAFRPIDAGTPAVVREGFDAGIRSGDIIAGDMVSVRLTPPFRTMIAASPGYVAVKGRPKTIADLKQHVLIGLSPDECQEPLALGIPRQGP